MKFMQKSGTGVAVVTPFTASKSVDYPSLGNILEHCIDNGVDYIVVLGTTGETPTLSAAEKHDIIRFTVEKVDKRVPIVAGISGNSTGDVVYSIEKTDLRGISAILSVVPYYNKPNQEGIYYHYKTLNDMSPLPVIAYNVPGRTGVNMQAETTLRIANNCKNIVAVKEASGNISQIMTLLKNRPEHFSIISGDDALTFPLLALGADGVISVVAQALPKPFSEMVRLALKGYYDKARVLHFKMLNLMDDLFADGNPAGVKAALHLLGLCENELRLPLLPVNKNVFERIQHDLEKI